MEHGYITDASEEHAAYTSIVEMYIDHWSFSQMLEDISKEQILNLWTILLIYIVSLLQYLVQTEFSVPHA